MRHHSSYNICIVVLFIFFISCEESTPTKSKKELTYNYEAVWTVKVIESGTGNGLDNVLVKYRFTDSYENKGTGYTDSDGIFRIKKYVSSKKGENSPISVVILALIKEGYVYDIDYVFIGRQMDFPSQTNHGVIEKFYLRKESY